MCKLSDFGALIDMKKVAIASENPVKIEVAKRAFAACFPGEEFEFIGIKSDSGVLSQPKGEAQTLEGAKNRVEFIKGKVEEADYFVGQEEGVIIDDNEMRETAFVVIEDRKGFAGIGRTATFIIPQKMAEMIKNGDEAGIANDKFFGLSNSKQAGGVIGSLTDGIVDRTGFLFQAAAIALMQTKHKEWYLKKQL